MVGTQYKEEGGAEPVSTEMDCGWEEGRLLAGTMLRKGLFRGQQGAPPNWTGQGRCGGIQGVNENEGLGSTSSGGELR